MVHLAVAARYVRQRQLMRKTYGELNLTCTPTQHRSAVHTGALPAISGAVVGLQRRGAEEPGEVEPEPDAHEPQHHRAERVQ